MHTKLTLAIAERGPFAGGAAFGDTGPYERIVARARFAVDPEAPAQRTVVDLENAPRDSDGLVEFSADVFLLRPSSLARGNRRVLVEFANRGNKRALQFFNDARHSNALLGADDAGNGFLMRRGYAVGWIAWQADVLPGDGRLTLDVPVAMDHSRPITAPVRAEFVVDERIDALVHHGTCRSQLREHRVEVAHPVVDHVRGRAGTKIGGIGRECRPDGLFARTSGQERTIRLSDA